MKFPRLAALAAALFTSLSSHAFLVNAPAPPGWAAGAAGEFATYRAASTEAWAASRVATSVAIATAGASANLPVTLRLAANAPIYAARFLFTNPLVAVASIGLTAWLASKQIHWDDASKQWLRDYPGAPTTGTIWRPYGAISGQLLGEFTSEYAACSAFANDFAAAQGASGGLPRAVQSIDGLSPCRFTTVFTQQYAGVTRGESYTIPSASGQIPGPLTTSPISSPEMETAMAPVPLPDLQPNELPTPLPVIQPLLNPDPSGNPQPLRVPQGAPQPVPNTNPQQYKTPVVDVVPYQTPALPWQVDLQPKDVTTNDPNSVTNPSSPASPSQSITCGLPGTPPCKIDEVGTPTTKDLPVDDAPIKADQQTRRDTISGTQDKPFFSPYQALFNAPPVASCSPFSFPSVSIGPSFTAAPQTLDPCGFVDTARAAVGVGWALVSFWLCLGWVREAI